VGRPAADAGMAYDDPGAGLRGVAAGAHRVPVRRRWDAAAGGDRLDAQPGADGHRELPRQGPACLVAARGPALHGALAATATSPPTRMAGSGFGDRHRRGALLPGVQPGGSGAAFDPDGAYVRRWVPELGVTFPGPPPTSRGATRRGMPRAIPRGSSTTRRSARRHCAGMPRPAPDSRPPGDGRVPDGVRSRG
jgi:hypothetical protein